MREMSMGDSSLPMDPADAACAARNGPEARIVPEAGIAASPTSSRRDGRLPCPQMGLHPGIRWFVALVGLCGLSHPADAGCRTHATSGVTQATSAGPDAPSESTAIRAFLCAREWLDADRLPSPGTAEAAIELPEAHGVAVLLRLDGRLVGAGVDEEPDGRMLRRAVGRAVAAALADSTIAAVREAAGDRITARLALEIELAGPLRPLLGRTIAEAAERVVPGADGLALRHGARIVRAFPSRLLAADLAGRIDANLVALIRSAGLPPRDLDEFGAEERVSLARFSTIRLREARPGAAPSVVTRAGRRIDLAEITAASTRARAAALATLLADRVVPRDPKDPARGVALLGTYNPTADAHDPPFAAPSEEAHAAVALALASECDALPTNVRLDAARKSVALADMVVKERPEELRPELVAMAVLARRMAARTSEDAADPAIDARFARLLASVEEAPADGLPEGSERERPGPEATAWIAAACAAAGDPDSGARSAAVVDRLLGDPASARTAMLWTLPLAIAARTDAFPTSRRAGIARLALGTLRELRTLQAGDPLAMEADLPPDLEGVLVLPRALRLRSDASFLPHVVGVVLGLATPSAEGSDEPAPDEADLLAVRRFVRALAQFTADEPWIDGFRNPAALRGLVRSSLHGDDCPPWELANGLLLAVAAVEAGRATAPDPAPH